MRVFSGIVSWACHFVTFVLIVALYSLYCIRVHCGPGRARARAQACVLGTTQSHSNQEQIALPTRKTRNRFHQWKPNQRQKRASKGQHEALWPMRRNKDREYRTHIVPVLCCFGSNSFQVFVTNSEVLDHLCCLWSSVALTKRGEWIATLATRLCAARSDRHKKTRGSLANGIAPESGISLSRNN